MSSSKSSSDASGPNDEEEKKRNVETEPDVKKEKSVSNTSKERESRSCSGTSLQMTGSLTSLEETPLFRCPEFGDEVHSIQDWKLKFREQLLQLKETDDILAAILTIKSLNPDRDAEQCISVIEKYLRNLIDYPEVDKYRCIRLGNQIFNEKVVRIEGGLDFLLSIGFKTAVGGENNMEPYLVYSPTKQIDLESVVKSLRSVTAFELELERNMTITYPQDVGRKEDITDEFYDWTISDMRKEQKARREEIVKNSQFRRRSKKSEGSAVKGDYPYTRIRVKFPDGVIVEAFFSVKEKLYSLKTFLQSKFYFYENFRFMCLPTRLFDVFDEDKTYAELELFPNVTLMLKWETNSPGQKYVLKENT